MAWTKTVHECRKPSKRAIPYETKAGSVWACDTNGCGRSWRLVADCPRSVAAYRGDPDPGRDVEWEEV